MHDARIYFMRRICPKADITLRAGVDSVRMIDAYERSEVTETEREFGGKLWSADLKQGSYL